MKDNKHNGGAGDHSLSLTSDMGTDRVLLHPFTPVS